MKQIPLTTEVKAWLQAALGEDVDVSNFAVFESISLNDRPLPGKRGTLFEGAVAPASTLLKMANHINGGNSLPLMIDHQMAGSPKGRIFRAALNYDDSGVQLRTLFYIDPTETDLIAKVNNGTYDEVSVQFLAEKILCSECNFDYRGDEATWENLLGLSCNEGHSIGKDGVHARLSGLEQFVEISLVARGAADKPKIVGRSASKLAPETRERLAAQGFENLDGLICQASLGEDTVDVNKLITELSEAKADVKVRDASVTTLTAERDTATAALTAAQSDLTARDEKITALTAERDTALAASRVEDADAATAYLSELLTKLRVAAGKDADELPKTVAELTAAIDAENTKLTAVLPTGGVSVGAGDHEGKGEAKPSYAAFKINR